jgi:hypothetical protein
MGIFDNVKKGALKTKLRGEMAILDQQIKSQKCAFGVQLYDLMTAAQQQKKQTQMPSIFHAKSGEIQAPYDECQRDIQVKLNDRDAKALEVERLAVNLDRALPATTNRDQVKQAGNWVSAKSNAGKLHVRMALLDRDINHRKEQFGLQVFDLLVVGGSSSSSSSAFSSATAGDGGGIKSKLASVAGLSGLQTSEKEIQACIAAAGRDVAILQSRKDAKQREMDAIDDGLL